MLLQKNRKMIEEERHQQDNGICLKRNNGRRKASAFRFILERHPAVLRSKDSPLLGIHATLGLSKSLQADAFLLEIMMIGRLII